MLNLHPAPPTLQPPNLPNHQQRLPSQQPMDLVHITGIPAGNNAATATATPIVAVPVDRRPSEEPVMIPISSTSPALGREAAALSLDDRGCGTGEAGGGYGTVLDYRDPRRGCRPLSQWSSYLLGGPPPVACAPWAESLRLRDREPSFGGLPAGALSNGEQLLAPPGPADVRGGYQHGRPYSWPAPPALSTSGGGGRYQEARSIPLAALAPGYGRDALSARIQERGAVGVDAPPPTVGTRDPYRHAPAPSSSAAEAAVEMTRPSPPPSWDDAGSRGRGGEEEARPRGGGLASPGHGGSRWRSAGDRRSGSDGVGEYTALDHERGLYGINQPQRDSPPRYQYQPRSSQPRDQPERSRLSQLRPQFPPAGTAVTPPRLGPGDDGISDPGSFDVGVRRSRFLSATDSARPALPGQAEAVATVGDEAAGGRKVFTFGESGVDLAGGGGGGDGAGAGGTDGGAGVPRGKHTERRR